mmetsp:Transcript_52955/g.139550  ORF Transcript_52955/g.139550 Transcript_52955/m.139550 type:complete len:85 (-) Transcript_52955:1349-1603(-)
MGGEQDSLTAKSQWTRQISSMLFYTGVLADCLTCWSQPHLIVLFLSPFSSSDVPFQPANAQSVLCSSFSALPSKPQSLIWHAET